MSRLVASAPFTAERRLIFTGRGYVSRDMSQLASFVWGSSQPGQAAGVVIHELDAQNYVRAYLTDDGTSSRIVVQSIVAGAVVQTVSTALSSRLASGQTVWVDGRAEGYVCTADVFLGQPGPSTAAAQTSELLLSASGERAIVDSPGRGGIYWIPMHPNSAVLSWSLKPYTFTRRALPEAQTLRNVPGTATPLMDLEVTTSGGAAAPIFALLSWGREPAPFNWVWNGDFEDDTSGWILGSAFYGAAATSINRILGTAAAPAKFGQAFARVVAPATANTGTHFKIYRRFRKGVTYTATIWVRGNTGSDTVFFSFGNEAGSSFIDAAGLAVTPGTGWTTVTAQWTPTADSDVAFLFVKHSTATAITFDIDVIQVYKGTVAPTAGLHAQGKGAQPPQGIIKAESQRPADLSGWAITADANYLGGYGLKITTAGAGTAAAAWLIDPSLVDDDEYVPGEVHVEVWCVYELAATVVSPRLVLSATPEAGGPVRYTGDGSTGKALVKPSSGTVKRLARVGVIRLPTADLARWKLKLAASWAAGSTGLLGMDALFLAPSRRRAASPSGKANDASYPRFAPSTAEITRRILSDLRGQTTKEPGVGPYADAGLGGSVLELPAPPAGAQLQDIELLAKLSSLAPDDPSSDTTTEQLAHTATVHAAIVPRYYLARPS